MASAKSGTGFLSLPSLRGGVDSDTPPHLMPDDACSVAENVEFYFSALGERRAGMEELAVLGSGLETVDAIVHLSKHNPTDNEEDAQLWAVGNIFDVDVIFSVKDPGVVDPVWEEITPVDAADPASIYTTKIQAQTLHAKHFFAYKSADGTDRLHVWDGSILRRAGLAQPPAAPTAGNSAEAGTYTGERFFRIRYTEQDSDGNILRRSEPSDSVAFTPDGAHDGAIITRPALINESETHWEVEASEDDANFWRIAIVAVATTTYEDNTDPLVEDYEDIGVLSADIGDYNLIPSVKYLSVDQDRLVMASSWEEPTHNARVFWTPVFNDPGVGNDERVSLDTDSFIDLDTFEGGGLTGLASPTNGTIYAFKWSQVFQLNRTGDPNHAYEATAVSKTVGALPNTIVQGLDEHGRGCIYFLDPATGPYRIGQNGLQRILGLQEVWRIMNSAAEFVPAFGLYYPDKQQVHWWVTVTSRDWPNLKVVLQTNEVRETAGGLHRGWATVANSLLAGAICGCTMSELTERETGSIALNNRPYIGFRADEDEANLLDRADIGTTDNGVAYRAILRSKAFILAGLPNRWGGMMASLLAEPIEDTTLQVKFIRDYGLEENTILTDLDPVGDEDFVIKDFDNLRMSEARAIQFEFSDPE